MMSALPPVGRRNLPPARPPFEIKWHCDLGDMTVEQAPVAHDDVIAARSGGTVGAVRHNNGELLWTRRGTDDDRSPLVGTQRGVIVVTTGGQESAQIAALDWVDGREIWRSTAPGFPGECAASSDGHDLQLLTYTDSSTLLHDFDLASGELRWSVEVPPTSRDLLVNDGYTLLSGRDLINEDRGLYRFTHGSGEIAKLLSNDVWSLHPGEVVDVVSVSDFRAPENAFILAINHDSGEPSWRRPATQELVDVDRSEVVCVEESDGESVVVLREAASGDEVWRAGGRRLEAGGVFFTGDTIGVVDTADIWFNDRITGEDLGGVEFESISSGVLVVTTAGVVISADNGLTCLTPT